MAANSAVDQSYQKMQYDGASGLYQEIPNGANAHLGGNKKKWLAGSIALLCAALGLAYGVNTLRENPKKAIDKELANNSKVHMKSNGKLKLFDEFSKLV